MLTEEETSPTINCIECGEPMGYCHNTRSANKGNYKTEYFLRKPYKIEGSAYRRIRCGDCFHTKFGKYPVAPNCMTHAELTYLLGVPEDVSARKFKARALTLNNFMARYGEVEGTRKWQEYCEKQRVSNTYCI